MDKFYKIFGELSVAKWSQLKLAYHKLAFNVNQKFCEKGKVDGILEEKRNECDLPKQKKNVDLPVEVSTCLAEASSFPWGTLYSYCFRNASSSSVQSDSNGMTTTISHSTSGKEVEKRTFIDARGIVYETYEDGQLKSRSIMNARGITNEIFEDGVLKSITVLG
jgi:hypothetical protein